MTATVPPQNRCHEMGKLSVRSRSPFNSIKFFVFCHGLLQLAQLLVSGYLKSSISTIEKRYGFSSQKSGLLACFNEVGNTILIVFVSFFGSRIHRPRFIGGGALIASLAGILMALPHFISGKYEYNHNVPNREENSLCHAEMLLHAEHYRQNCTQQQSDSHSEVLPIMLLGQLLLGIGGVPIQPFGISYIDDYASKKNSPFYLGILFAVTVIGPAFAFMLGSLMLQFYVDIDKLSLDEIKMKSEDPRWVGAWWLGFLVAASLLALTSLPYFFFPKKMPKEEFMERGKDSEPEKLSEEKMEEPDPLQSLSLREFLKSFPSIVMRTLRNPIYLLVVLAQVNLAAMVAGLATFMAKFIERQFTKTASFSNMMLGGVNIPVAVLGIVAGGVVMRRFSMTVKASALMSTIAVFICVLLALPLLFLGCSTQTIAGVYPLRQNGELACSLKCSCQEEEFNPVCGSNGVEYVSPCHAGCKTLIPDISNDGVLNYTDCSCTGVHGSSGFAVPGTCGSGCSHLLLPFMIFSALTGFVASFAHTPSFMMILRTVKPEDKSFALGVQFMLFRVLAFLPGPVLYGSTIDTTCILWGRKCNKSTSCRYYNLDLFRQRYLGLQVFFEFSGVVCFLMVFLILRKIKREQKAQQQDQTDGEKCTGNNLMPAKPAEKLPLQKVSLLEHDSKTPNAL
ncbi:solute carrier organic anion transporter family member 2B1-like [Megalops cyprinoides]|uniref:solute carrier organic anion transporter family member 2B1-like n=1 Tax=Megalops cyprinoides TaxID=118141 RepID=UPI001863C8C0|nr:solute carrier organic anion transporter family member 2B1-like [Megalops cyprinoides]XP_036393461.1 solute carrier organic anion transporter family member 2B1-like [Megalops cyprinoides]XP_036393462.1 solute carrier organic anion transporter family member 2B1-like [Megalops cyprinoides]